MRYRAIQEHDRRYPIRLMCRALAVSAAGYYAWRSRPESPRSIYARTLFSAIRVIHQESRETYDSPSIWNALVKQGHRIGEHRVARLMRQAGLWVVARHFFTVLARIPSWRISRATRCSPTWCP